MTCGTPYLQKLVMTDWLCYIVAINTAVGQTKRVNIPEITQQGGTWGPMMCSNSIDVIGKSATENNKGYSYKNLVNVIPMVDDLLAAVPCGFKSIEMNVFMNTTDLRIHNRT